jgi:hypothetical protein
MDQRERERRADERRRPAKPLVDAYDPFEQLFRPKRPKDELGEVFELRVGADEF